MHVDADSIPDTPTVSNHYRFKRLVNFLKLRKNMKTVASQLGDKGEEEVLAKIRRRGEMAGPNPPKGMHRSCPFICSEVRRRGLGAPDEDDGYCSDGETK